MKISLAFFAAILGTVASFGGTFNTSGYGRTTTLVCSGYSGASSLVNFPVLVKFATNRVDQFYYQDFKVNASDLRFTDSDGNEIPYEIDTWNTNGTSVVWVSAPSLTSATTLHAYWNNAAATKPAYSTNGTVWAGNSYVSVWHLNESINPIIDSTTNKINGTRGSAMYASASGLMGGAQLGSSSLSSYIETSVCYSKFASISNFTFSGWVKGSPSLNGQRLLSSKIIYSDNGLDIFSIKNADNSYSIGARGSGNALRIDHPLAATGLSNTWLHLAFVYNNTAISLYTNGCFVKSGTIDVAKATSYPLTIGAFAGNRATDGSYPGLMDEFRIRNGVSASDWIKAEYDTVKSDSFIVASPVSILYPKGFVIRIM